MDEYSCSIDYDREGGFLALRRPKTKATYSMEAGALTLDFYKNSLIGIEIENAARYLTEIIGRKISKKDLEEATHGRLASKNAQNSLTIFFAVKINGEKIEKEFILPKVEESPAITLAARN